ncbi:MAG: hypothetical protein H7249_05315 [Chitinophagaceae bacterium]|nr:hypothetical protein [Oligoflexus sp.]
MNMHLYLVVSNRNAPTQNFENEWGMQGKLMQIETTDAVVEAANQAIANGSRIFVYEINCKKPLKSHISQELKIASINGNIITFDQHNLIYRKAPFTANQKIQSKWHADEPTERIP